MRSAEGDAARVINVLLIEDHAVFRQTLALAFSLNPGLRVVGQGGSLIDGHQLLAATETIDVVILDLDLPDGNGVTLIPAIHLAHPQSEVLVLTASVLRLDLARALEAGAAGVLHKSTPFDEIVVSIRRVAAGDSLFTRRELIELVQMLGRQRDAERATKQTIDRLTPREREVLLALADGLSDGDIAQRLFISRDTVHTHMEHLLVKLNVESRMQALIFAVKAGLISLD